MFRTVLFISYLTNFPNVNNQTYKSKSRTLKQQYSTVRLVESDLYHSRYYRFRACVLGGRGSSDLVGRAVCLAKMTDCETQDPQTKESEQSDDMVFSGSSESTPSGEDEDIDPRIEV